MEKPKWKFRIREVITNYDETKWIIQHQFLMFGGLFYSWWEDETYECGRNILYSSLKEAEDAVKQYEINNQPEERIVKKLR